MDSAVDVHIRRVDEKHDSLVERFVALEGKVDKILVGMLFTSLTSLLAVILR